MHACTYMLRMYLCVTEAHHVSQEHTHTRLGRCGNMATDSWIPVNARTHARTSTHTHTHMHVCELDIQHIHDKEQVKISAHTLCIKNHSPANASCMYEGSWPHHMFSLDACTHDECFVFTNAGYMCAIILTYVVCLIYQVSAPSMNACMHKCTQRYSRTCTET
jgi:hypothetical protein